MDLKYIWELPESMPKEKVESHFVNLLDFAEEQVDHLKLDELKILEILEALDQLSERQGYTYELLDDTTMIRVESLIDQLLNFNNENIVEMIASIVLKLGLKNVFNNMKNALKDELPQKVKMIIQETIDEAGDHIEDPYHSIKK